MPVAGDAIGVGIADGDERLVPVGELVKTKATVMSVEVWNKDEIKKLALVSGEPLEVECAEAFLKTGWQVRLGSFYNDVSTEKVQELDVLIQKNRTSRIGNADREVCVKKSPAAKVTGQTLPARV